MEVILGILLFFVLLWIISFTYNIYFFFKNDDTELDTVFINISNTFEEAYQKLNTLEKVLGRELKGPKNKLKFYEDNARKTRRKYNYYSDYIEPAFIKIYVGSLGSMFKKSWKHLDAPVKYHYINIYIFIGLTALFFFLICIAVMGWSSIILLIIVTAFLLRLYNFIIKINLLFFYLLIDGVLIIFKQDRGKLMKNIALLELLTKGWFGGSTNGYVIGAAGVALYSGYDSGGSDFSGFGGGSSGGGGAGGSW